ncbi:hypothetical protein [Photobacterium profundum]|nr:hypothetical protein [Photobacterium profundum]
MKVEFKVIFVIFVLAALFVFFSYLLIDGGGTLSLTEQMTLGYEVIYIDVSYMSFISAVISIPFIIIAIIIVNHCRKKNKNLTSYRRFFIISTVVVLLSLGITIPGRSLEAMRVTSIVENRGYIKCPTFTLLFGVKAVDAFARRLNYCHEPEIMRIAQYGYMDELETIDLFIKRKTSEK